MERAILARHGESEVSVRGLVNGDVSVRVALTEAGREQARRLAEQLAGDAIDLCVTSEFGRVIETADRALEGRDVARLVVPELNDPRYGTFEGGTLEEYRSWAGGASSADVPPGDGESRLAIVGRYVKGFRALLARRERTILVVGHSLPLAYVLGAVEGEAPGRRVPLVEYAVPHRLTAEELSSAVELLEAWVTMPTW